MCFNSALELVGSTGQKGYVIAARAYLKAHPSCKTLKGVNLTVSRGGLGVGEHGVTPITSGDHTQPPGAAVTAIVLTDAICQEIGDRAAFTSWWDDMGAAKGDFQAVTALTTIGGAPGWDR